MVSRLFSFVGTRLPLLAAYALAGALVGLVLIHPAVLAIVWLEFRAIAPDPPSLPVFLSDRLLLFVIPRDVQMTLAFAGLGALVGLAFGALTRSYVEASQGLRFFREIHGEEIPALIAKGETADVEFKATMRWDVKEQRINKQLETVIAKTIAGFFNARGGRLLIGVADDGTVLGLEDDYATLRLPTRDGFEQTVTSIVAKFLGGDLNPALQTTFASIDGKDVCMILVQPAPRAVYLSDGGKLHFYVRSGNATRQLDLREAMDYARTRWP
ncbi:ATP-binding protein [Stappia sp.]|uniref:AlbA family DNA-binding domain-containing protein n=1 Tax=Stappia sp. TaxID=1870903 RepID=UPI0032D92C8C